MTAPPPPPSRASPPMSGKGFVGTWRLVSMTLRDQATGEETDLWGTGPIGFLSYTRGGRMSAVIAAADGTHSVAYAGTYSPTGAGVVHHVEVATELSWVGTDQPRSVRVDGDRLTVSGLPPDAVDDSSSRTLVLVWERVE